MNLLIEILFITAIIGFMAYILERKIRITNLLSKIQNENFKYTYNQSSEVDSDSNNLLGIVILIAAIVAFIGSFILCFASNTYNGMLCLISSMILFSAFIYFYPCYLSIKNGNIRYKHIINTLNKTVVIPMGKIESAGYWQESLTKKTLSLIINNDFKIDINMVLISNSDEILNTLNEYIINRTKNIDQSYNENNINSSYVNMGDKIQVHTGNDYKLFITIAIAIELSIIFSIVMGFRDIITLSALIIFPLFILLISPYKITFYGDRLEYKHILYTYNKTKTINVSDIIKTDIIKQRLFVPMHNEGIGYTNSFTYYILMIYMIHEEKKFTLLFEDMSDIKRINNIINITKENQYNKLNNIHY